MQKQIKTLLTWIQNNRNDLTQLQPSCSSIILNLAVIYAKFKKSTVRLSGGLMVDFFIHVQNKRLSAHHHFYQNFITSFFAKKVMCTQTFVKKYKRKIQKTWDFVQNFLCKKFNATRKVFASLNLPKAGLFFFAAEIRIRFFKKVLGALHKNFQI